jgi:hypothetical protein
MADYKNGLISSRTVCLTGATASNAFVRVGKAGDVEVAGDLDVLGDIYASTIISIPDISLNPFYIRNTKNLGNLPIEASALVIEGGADRIDISGEPAMVTIYKPLTALQTPGTQEDIAGVNFAGKNSAGTTVRYASVVAECTNATAGSTMGRLELRALRNTTHESFVALDASTQTFTTIGTNCRFADRGYNIYPGAVKITTAGTITKQTTATLVPESAFTIPVGLDGYYSFTAQISLGSVGTVADGENFQLYLDVSGGSLSPVNGTINILDMTENTANSFSQTPGGIIMQRLTAGQTIQLYHLEQGSYTFSSGSIQVAYTYLGDTAL